MFNVSGCVCRIFTAECAPDIFNLSTNFRNEGGGAAARRPAQRQDFTTFGTNYATSQHTTSTLDLENPHNIQHPTSKGVVGVGVGVDVVADGN